MKRKVHRAIVEAIEAEEFDYHECLETLKAKFPTVRPESLSSILSQEYQKRVKRSYQYQTCSTKRKENYVLFKQKLGTASQKGTIVDIAKQNRFSATLTAKALLVDHLIEKTGKSPTKQQISQLMRDTNLIEDPEIAVQVHKATLHDENYGYLAECTKRSIGAEYERRLKRHLRELNMTYQDEHDLRVAGYDKTPDVKLDIPIAVNGSIVNWIESRALFGDEENHTSYLNDQLWSYWNRFGPGLVIYWCGYLKHLEWSTEHGILVRDKFPSQNEIVYLDPLKGVFDDFDTDPDDDTSADDDDTTDEDENEDDTEGAPKAKGDAKAEAEQPDLVKMTNNLKLKEQ